MTFSAKGGGSSVIGAFSFCLLTKNPNLLNHSLCLNYKPETGVIRMKNVKITKALTTLILLSVLTACGNTGADKPGLEPEQTDESWTIPENVTIEFDPEGVTSVESAKTYSAEYWYADDEMACEALLKAPVTEKIIYAEGPQYIAETDGWTEYLTLKDGGAAFGVDSGVYGGLYYGLHLKDGQDYITTTWSDFAYPTETDLTFLPYADALADIEASLNTLGVPELKLYKTYSMDSASMNEGYASEDSDSESMSFSEDNEQYVFKFRQIIDGIPVNNEAWRAFGGSSNSAAGNVMTNTEFELYYSKEGICGASANDLFVITEEHEKENLISPDVAIGTLMTYQDSLLQVKPVRVTSMELCYVSTPDGEQFTLRPAWVFNVGKEYDFESADGITSQFIYELFVIDAISGEIISE